MRFKVLIISLFLLSSFSFSKISYLSKPMEAYVLTHYPNQSVRTIEYNKKARLIEVLLEDMAVLKFNKKGQISYIYDIDTIRESQLPKDLFLYLKNNHKENYVKEWGVNKKSQYVILEDNSKVNFDKKGIIIED